MEEVEGEKVEREKQAGKEEETEKFEGSWVLGKGEEMNRGETEGEVKCRGC